MATSIPRQASTALCLADEVIDRKMLGSDWLIRTRVGVVPYNEDVYNAFGINQYSNKEEVLEAICTYPDSRPGVQKMAIVVIDAPSAAREKTRAEVLCAHDMGVEIFAIGIGPEVDEEELAHMASTPEHVFLVHDTRSLVLVRRHLEHRFRLGECVGPLSQSETLEIVWTAYPPEACDLQDKARSRWIRPVVGGKEAYALLDDDIIRQTGLRPCLQLVIQSRLRRDGFIILPSDVRDGVQRVTNEAQALDLIDKTRSAAGACASRPRRESPAEDLLTCTYFLIEGTSAGASANPAESATLEPDVFYTTMFAVSPKMQRSSQPLLIDGERDWRERDSELPSVEDVRGGPGDGIRNIEGNLLILDMSAGRLFHKEQPREQKDLEPKPLELQKHPYYMTLSYMNGQNPGG
ncbi:hypothetical protein DPMN_146401 [Dreissena polymorpha]|uniref:VWFA domain-containing protein n=1 Tax=Dreissena polymorpha TaxID=45954 RepID=A0A9D4FA89_DREPO|nr:hypothetical protein DPMN_146401 [Dreissena polymorpha]